MGLLDDLIKGSGGLGAVASLAAKNPQILSAAVSLLSSKDSSVGGAAGLAGLMSAFQGKGLGDVMSSWVSTGANKSISPSQIASVLGNDTLSQFASKAGIGAGEASSVLSSLLPSLVNHVTPDGNVPKTNALDSV
ncbi:MAG: YidB family protein, partial [Vicinamibacteria bacterium]